MSNKVVIGEIAGDLQRADAAERSAGEASSELTMIRRRIRTFFDAIAYVQFPVEAPAWASDWHEWLQTGEVVQTAQPEEVVVEQEVGLIEEPPVVLGTDGLLPPDEKVI